MYEKKSNYSMARDNLASENRKSHEIISILTDFGLFKCVGPYVSSTAACHLKFEKLYGDGTFSGHTATDGFIFCV